MRQIIISIAFICSGCFTVFAQAVMEPCPTISVTGPSTSVSPGKSMEFSASVTGAENNNIEYLWSVSNGKIISGLGSKKITAVSDTGSLTAAVEMRGLPEKCPNTASESYMHEGNYAVKIDEFDDFGRSGTKSRIDDFFIKLLDDKEAEGIILFRNDKDLLRNIKYLRDHAIFRRFPLARLRVAVSAESDQLTQFWRFPNGAALTNTSEGGLIKLEDFEQLKKTFQPVKAKAKKQ